MKFDLQAYKWLILVNNEYLSLRIREFSKTHISDLKIIRLKICIFQSQRRCKMIGQDFAYRLSNFLEKKDISSAELARQLGVSKAAVSKWVSGGAIPSSKYILDLSRLLGVSPMELLDEEIPKSNTLTRSDSSHYKVRYGPVFNIRELMDFIDMSQNETFKIIKTSEVTIPLPDSIPDGEGFWVTGTGDGNAPHVANNTLAGIHLNNCEGDYGDMFLVQHGNFYFLMVMTGDPSGTYFKYLSESTPWRDKYYPKSEVKIVGRVVSLLNQVVNFKT